MMSCRAMMSTGRQSLSLTCQPQPQFRHPGYLITQLQRALGRRHFGLITAPSISDLFILCEDIIHAVNLAHIESTISVEKTPPNLSTPPLHSFLQKK